MKLLTGLSTSLLMTITFMANAQEPKAPEKAQQIVKHGHHREDPYFWMNQRDSAPVLNYIAQENTWTKNWFAPHLNLHQQLLKEFDQRIDPNESSAPYQADGRWYQERSVSGKDYQEIIRLNASGTSPESVFFDQNARAKGKSYYDLADWALSPNGELLAFSEDHVGRRKYSIYFRNEKTGKVAKETIKDTDGSLVWAADNKSLFYVRKDPQTLREFQVYRHVFGTDPAKDVLVYEEKDELFYVYLSKTLTDRYIRIQIVSSTTSEIRLINTFHPELTPEVFLPRKKGHLYEVTDHAQGFYVMSNDQAPNNKVLFYPDFPSKNQKSEEVIPHNPNKLIEQVIAFKNTMVMQCRENGLPVLDVYDLQTKAVKRITLREETYSLGLAANDAFDTDVLYYSYSSLTTPRSVYTYRFETGESTLFFQHKLIDPKFSPANYEARRLWATANDGTKIPISLVYRKGTDLRKAPLLLYGYGSYGITIPAGFNALNLSLLDRGFVYAIAHIRGGKDMGEEWYQNGKFLKKINTFTDFINCAEYLGMQGYCDPERIYAQGGSAGGLLMGAVTNMAPYLWKGVIAQVPFVDVVSTMLDESIPLTVGEYEEWGNPNDPEYYWYMLKYSPFDNVRRMDYPAMYITTGYHDSQVQYWEPLKWVARLRAYRTNQHPLLFDCNMDAGHGGGSGRTTERIETAKEFVFLLGMEGITE